MGARQVGKTFAMRWLGEQSFGGSVYCNFELDPGLRDFFDGSLEPKDLLKNLAIHLGKPIEAGRTLLIFDEVQECPRALTALKYFAESAPEYHVIAAGSLLGLKTQRAASFPVGKVEFLRLHPLTFFEFLAALGEGALGELARNSTDLKTLAKPFHERLLEHLRTYFFVGGMPEVVAHYCAARDYSAARAIQAQIVTAYLLDVSKHAAATDIPKILRIWEQLPGQLAKEQKRFLFNALAKSARAREYESALQWLVDADLVLRVQHVTAGRVPLVSYANINQFKLYPLDVGLLGAQSNLSVQNLVLGKGAFTELKGALTECYVAQELRASGKEAYYWTSCWRSSKSAGI